MPVGKCLESRPPFPNVPELGQIPERQRTAASLRDFRRDSPAEGNLLRKLLNIHESTLRHCDQARPPEALMRRILQLLLPQPVDGKAHHLRTVAQTQLVLDVRPMGLHGLRTQT